MFEVINVKLRQMMKFSMISITAKNNPGYISILTLMSILTIINVSIDSMYTLLHITFFFFGFQLKNLSGPRPFLWNGMLESIIVL